MAIIFTKAERKRAKARIAFCGPAGSGKTHSALKVAAGLGGKIAVVDTESGSAELEAGKSGMPEYDVLTMHAPFTPEKYVAAMEAAAEAGYDIVILDSITHAWAGTGGLLEQVDAKKKASKSGNSYTAWADVTPMHNKLVEAILQSPCHVIATMRTKADYVLESVNGKNVPKKVGMAPIQREGMDYEFTLVFDLDQASHYASATKDRTSLFDGKPEVPSSDTGARIREWLESGKEVTETQKTHATPSAPPKRNVGHPGATTATPVSDAELAEAFGASQSEWREGMLANGGEDAVAEVDAIAAAPPRGTITPKQTATIYALKKQLEAASKEDVCATIKRETGIVVDSVSALSSQKASAIIGALMQKADEKKTTRKDVAAGEEIAF